MSGKYNRIKKSTAPESTQACTSRYTDFQVLPVKLYNFMEFINLSYNGFIGNFGDKNEQ